MVIIIVAMVSGSCSLWMVSDDKIIKNRERDMDYEGSSGGVGDMMFHILMWRMMMLMIMTEKNSRETMI